MLHLFNNCHNSHIFAENYKEWRKKINRKEL